MAIKYKPAYQNQAGGGGGFNEASGSQMVPLGGPPKGRGKELAGGPYNQRGTNQPFTFSGRPTGYRPTSGDPNFINQNPFQGIDAPDPTTGERFDSSGYQQNPFDYNRGRYDVSGIERAGLGDFQGFEDRAMESSMRHLQPLQEADKRAFNQMMVNKGITDEGSDAYKNAYDNFTRSQNDARNAAAFSAMDFGMGAQNQDFGQRLAQGQFGAQLGRDQFGRDMSSTAYNNDLVNQRFGRDFSGAQFNEQMNNADFQRAMQAAGFGQSEQSRQFGQGFAYDSLNAQDLASQRSAGASAAASAASAGASRYATDARSRDFMAGLERSGSQFDQTFGEGQRQYDLGFGENQRQFNANDAYRIGRGESSDYFNLGRQDLAYRGSDLAAAQFNQGMGQQWFGNNQSMFPQFGQSGVPIDVQGAYGLNQQGQQNQYNARQAQYEADLQARNDLATAFFPSSKHIKDELGTVDSSNILDALNGLSVHEWRYRQQMRDQSRHIGPYAEDFNAAIGNDPDQGYISIIDMNGALLAAVQELTKRLEQLENASG